MLQVTGGSQTEKSTLNYIMIQPSHRSGKNMYTVCKILWGVPCKRKFTVSKENTIKCHILVGVIYNNKQS